MTLDDVYGAEADQFPLEQDALDWETIELEWDDEEADITAQYGRQLEE
jgi:hypothetical protein